jgi:cell pole-organizing protein PopZ
MSDENAEQEPSMEEILASIRRIISEDGDEEAGAEAAPEEQPAAEAEDVAEDVSEDEAEPEPESEPEPVDEAEEEVLELTDEVQDDGTVVNLKTGESVDEDGEGAEEDVELEMVDADEESAEDDLVFDNEPEPEPEPDPGPEPSALVEPIAAVAADRLVSQDPGVESVSSLAALAAAVDMHRRAVDPSIGPRTIEDLVKEVMRPMIREWLDANLPSLVERLVAREIERLTREAEDINQS